MNTLTSETSRAEDQLNVGAGVRCLDKDKKSWGSGR